MATRCYSFSKYQAGKIKLQTQKQNSIYNMDTVNVLFFSFSLFNYVSFLLSFFVIILFILYYHFYIFWQYLISRYQIDQSNIDSGEWLYFIEVPLGRKDRRFVTPLVQFTLPFEHTVLKITFFTIWFICMCGIMAMGSQMKMIYWC